MHSDKSNQCLPRRSETVIAASAKLRDEFTLQVGCQHSVNSAFFNLRRCPHLPVCECVLKPACLIRGMAHILSFQRVLVTGGAGYIGNCLGGRTVQLAFLTLSIIIQAHM